MNPKIQKSNDPSVPDWKTLGQREYDRLAQIYPIGTLRNILRAVKGQVIYDSLDPHDKVEVMGLVESLSKEYATGPALFILREADKAASHAERSARHTGKPRGEKPLH